MQEDCIIQTTEAIGYLLICDMGKSAFLYGTIKEEVYVHQPLCFVDPVHQTKFPQSDQSLLGQHQAPMTHGHMRHFLLFLMENRFRIGLRGEATDLSGYQLHHNILDQDKFQVTPKASHLNAVKRIFRYLKHQPKLGLWYPRDSPFELEAFSDSDYGGASLDRKSTTGGCQFLGRRLISWQCKKQTIVSNSNTEAEYVVAANCYGQVTPLFDSMLVQQIEDEGEASERPSDSQPIPSPPHPSEDQPQTHTDPSSRPSPSIAIPDSNLEVSGGNHAGQSSNDTSLSRNEDGSGQEAKERSQTTYHTSQSLDEECCTEEKISKEDFSKEKGGTKEILMILWMWIIHWTTWETEDDKDEAEDKLVCQNKQKEKEKRVEIRNAEDTERPMPTSTRSMLTLKPLPKIDPKDKGKKMIDEEEAARKVQEEWKAKEEKKRLAKEEATKEERDKFTIEQRAKFLHDTIAAQRKFLAQQRSEAIRNKPPTRNQLRNQMMTYLKHVGGKKHSDLKTKTFEEIQVLYERLKRQDQNFIAIVSAEDERKIKELNKDPEKKRLKKRVVNKTPREEDTTKAPAEQEVTEQGLEVEEESTAALQLKDSLSNILMRSNVENGNEKGLGVG
ncbi:hypothetical protein Tco_1554023 [Tanacetum coccineum]